MASNVVPAIKTNPVVLRRRSMNQSATGKRIHGIVFDHPSMPKIMAVSSVPNKGKEKGMTSPQLHPPDLSSAQQHSSQYQHTSPPQQATADQHPSPYQHLSSHQQPPHQHPSPHQRPSHQRPSTHQRPPPLQHTFPPQHPSSHQQHARPSPPALIHSPLDHESISPQEHTYSSASNPVDTTYYTETSSETCNQSSQQVISVDHARPSLHRTDTSNKCESQATKSTIKFPRTSNEYPREVNTPGYFPAMQYSETSVFPGNNDQDRFSMQHHPTMQLPRDKSERTMSYPNDKEELVLKFEYPMGSRGTAVKRSMSHPVNPRYHFEDGVGSEGPAPKRTMSYPNDQRDRAHYEQYHFATSSSSATKRPTIDHHNSQQTSLPSPDHVTRHSTNSIQLRDQQTRMRSNSSNRTKWLFHTDRHQVPETHLTTPVFAANVATMPTVHSARDQHALRHASTCMRLAQKLNARRKSTGGIRCVDNHHSPKSPSEILQHYHCSMSCDPERSYPNQQRNCSVRTPPGFVKPTLICPKSSSEVGRPRHRRHTVDSDKFYRELLLETDAKPSRCPSPQFFHALSSTMTSRDVRRNSSGSSWHRSGTRREGRDGKSHHKKTAFDSIDKQVYVISDSDEDIDNVSSKPSPSVIWDDDDDDEMSEVFLASEEGSEQSEAVYQPSRSLAAARGYSKNDHHSEHVQREENPRDMHARYSEERPSFLEDAKEDPKSLSTDNEDLCDMRKCANDDFSVPLKRKPVVLANECSSLLDRPPKLIRQTVAEPFVELSSLKSRCVRFSEENSNSNVVEHKITRVLNPKYFELATQYEHNPCKADGISEFKSNEHVAEDDCCQISKISTSELKEMSKIDLPTESLNPSLRSGFLTHQLSKLTDNVLSHKKHEPITETGSVSHIGATACAEERRGDQPRLESCKDTRNTVKVAKDKQRGEERKSVTHDKVHCPSCDCPGTQGKRSEITALKSGQKPTGIVVGIKKELHNSESVTPKPTSDMAKDPGGKTSGGGIDRVFGGFGKTSGQLEKGFGLLQFNVIEKVAGSAWRDNSNKSSEKGITSQQWEAYSVKLEEGKRKTQCDRTTSDGVVVRDGKKPGKLLGDVSSHRVAFQKWREDSDLEIRPTQDRSSEGLSDTEGGECVKNIVSSNHLEMQKIELNAENVRNEGLSGEQQESDDFGRKRPKPHHGSIPRLVKDELDGKKCLSEISKRHRVEERKGDGGETLHRDVGVNTENESKENKVFACGHELTAQLKGLSIATISRKVKEEEETEESGAKPVLKVAANQEEPETRIFKTKDGDIKYNEVKLQVVKSTEMANSEKKEALTSKEWKEILIGRIDQVRESIEVEQTPWKTKNKRKVLEKLEHQLKGWESCSPNECAAFLARKLQFLQTVRHQYELMKRIDAERNIGKKAVKNIKADERPKSIILKVQCLKENVTQKKNTDYPKQDLTKKKSLSHSNKKFKKANLGCPVSTKKEHGKEKKLNLNDRVKKQKE